MNNSVSHEVFYLTLHDSQFLSVESFGVIIFGLLMGRIWLYFGKIGKPVHDIDKFNIGFILMGIVFLLFYVATVMGGGAEKVPALVFVIGFLILSISELCLSAIGLSMVTKVAPKGFVSLYMGIWLVTLGIGGKLAGLLSMPIIISDDIVTSKINMAHGFLIFIGVIVFAIILCLAFRRIIIKNYPSEK